MIRFRSNYQHLRFFFKFQSTELSIAILDFYLANYIALFIFLPIKLIFSQFKFNLLLGGYCNTLFWRVVSARLIVSYYLWLVRARVLFVCFGVYVCFPKYCQIVYENQNKYHLSFPQCQHPEPCMAVGVRSAVGREASISLQRDVCRWTLRLKVSKLFGTGKLSKSGTSFCRQGN